MSDQDFVLGNQFYSRDPRDRKYWKCWLCEYREDWDGETTGKLCPRCRKERLLIFTRRGDLIDK